MSIAVSKKEKIFDELLRCTTDEPYSIAERLADQLTTEEMARAWIITLFQRAPKLTEEQEKRLHQLGRKERKRFGMKPMRTDDWH